MASGSCQGCEEKDEETLKKLIVRLNNVQEGKQIETLVQILEDMLLFTYADHGNHLQGNCSFITLPPPASFANRLPYTLRKRGPLGSHKLYSLGQKGAENSRKVLRSLLLLSPRFSYLTGAVNRDLASFPPPPSFPASKLFQGKNIHVPLLFVLDSYMRVASVQQVKELFSFLPFPLFFGNTFMSMLYAQSSGLVLRFGLTYQ